MLANVSAIVDQAWAWFVAPLGAVAALLGALRLSRGVMAHPEGEPAMVEIAAAVRSGAMAYLRRQYKVLLLLLAALVAMGLTGMQDPVTPVGVLFACLFSGLRGWFGMKMATGFDAAYADGDAVPIADGRWRDELNAWEVEVRAGEGRPLRFQIVPTRGAMIRQVLEYYDVTLMNPRLLGGVFIGVSLNILIKLIAIVSVVFAGPIVRFSPAIASWIGLE